MNIYIIALILIFQSVQAYELTVACMFRNCAPYMKEWIEYHRLVGVEHFWLYNDESTDNWEEVLKPYMNEGVVEVIPWKADKPKWSYDQVRAYRDAIRRAVGVSTWIALIDADEFLVPMQMGTVTESLRRFYKGASAAYLNWRCFGTSEVTLKEGEPMLSQLTACAPKGDGGNSIGKSIVRPERVRIEEVWYVHHCPLIDGSIYLDGCAEQTLRPAGEENRNWITSGIYHERVLRINHYILRDEKFFRENKVRRLGAEKAAKLHEILNKERDEKILDMLQKYHPKKYEEIWRDSRNESLFMQIADSE